MITAIAAGRSTVYAATCNGVYRSDDGAASWHEAGLQRSNVVRLAVDPHGDADTLYAIVDNHVFVGLYPEPSYLTGIAVTLMLGSTLWVSRDGGRTWDNREVPNGQALAVDLSQPGTAYVASYFATYAPLAVTHDSGTTWRVVPEAPNGIFSELAVDPRDGALYAATGAFLSTLSAGSWSNLAIQVNLVATGSGSDGAVFAAGHNTFCRKTNAESWTCIALPENVPLNILEIPGQAPGQGARILLLTFDGIATSDDGGASFSPAVGEPEGYTPVAALDPSGAAVYAGNDIGVYRSTDRGATWTKTSAGLSSTWVRALAIDSKHPSTIWAGAEARVSDVFQVGAGLFKSTDGGESWASASVAGEPGYVFSLGIDPSNSQNLFTASFGRADRSVNGGTTWTETGAAAFGGFIHVLAVDPASSSKVWAADGGLKASGDGGESWSTVLSEEIYSVVFDARHPGTLYAGEAWESSYYPYGTGWAVQTSRDGGATWKRTGADTDGAVTAFAADPFSDSVVYASTYAGTILRSTDSGATWAQWNTTDLGVSIFALVADPVRSGVLYVGGWDGVHRSQDGGMTWDPFGEGLDPYAVFGLAVSPDGRWLYAGTTGGGVFRRDLPLPERTPPNPVSRARPTREVIRP